MQPTPTPVECDYVRRILYMSSCFRDADGGAEACRGMPCACAQSLIDEIGRPLWLKIERLRVALSRLVESPSDQRAVDLGRIALRDE